MKILSKARIYITLRGMVIGFALYLWNEKPSLIEKELPVIINSYYVWDYYESEKYGRIGMLKF